MKCCAAGHSNMAERSPVTSSHIGYVHQTLVVCGNRARSGRVTAASLNGVRWSALQSCPPPPSRCARCPSRSPCTWLLHTCGQQGQADWHICSRGGEGQCGTPRAIPDEPWCKTQCVHACTSLHRFTLGASQLPLITRGRPHCMHQLACTTATTLLPPLTRSRPGS